MDSTMRGIIPVYGNPNLSNSIYNDPKYEIKIKALKQKLSKSVSVQLESLENKKSLENEDEEEEKGWRKYTGLLLALQSSLVFSLTALIVKQLTNHNPISISLWRFQGTLWPSIPFFIQHILCSGKVKLEKEPIKSEEFCSAGRLKIFVLLMARSILACNSFILNFYSLKYLQIGDALAIASSTPVFVTLFAHYFLGEQCGLVPILTTLSTVFGVIVIARPPHLTGAEHFDFDTLVGTSLALGCMLCGTISYVLLRYLRKLHYSTVTLAFGAWGTFENILVATFFGVLSLPEGTLEWAYGILLVILAFAGQLCIVFALKKELAGPVALVRTLDVIFAFCWQITCMGNVPDIYSFVGATIIIMGIVLTACRKWVSSLPENNASRKRFQFLLM